MDCSLPGSSIHEIFQARVLEWVAIAFSVQYMLGTDKYGLISLIQVGLQDGKIMHQKVDDCVNEFF